MKSINLQIEDGKDLSEEVDIGELVIKITHMYVSFNLELSVSLVAFKAVLKIIWFILLSVYISDKLSQGCSIFDGCG